MDNEPRLLLNRIRTPDGKILESRDRHDYRTYLDANGLKYMVDGGNDYLRRNVHKEAPYEEISLYTDTPHEELRRELTWGTYGESKDYSEIDYVKIKNLSTRHINNILDDGYGSKDWRKMLNDELAWREQRESNSEAKRLEVQRENSYG